MDEPRLLAVSVAYPARDQAVVSVSGDLDLRGVGALREPLSAALESPVVVLDLSRCTFCDSSGLRAIMEAGRRARPAGSSFRVAGVGVHVGRLFELTGADAHLDVFPDLETALKGERAH